jgi:hypothetical protein
MTEIFDNIPELKQEDDLNKFSDVRVYFWF